MTYTPPADDTLCELLTAARVIAVVGYSDKPHRTSYRIGRFLEWAGYMVYPVNPCLSHIGDTLCYPTLADMPEQVDIVNVFRRSGHLAGVVDEAIAIGAKAVWAQLGVYDEVAAYKAVTSDW